MNLSGFIIPKENNTIFLHPPLDKIEESIINNRKLIELWSFHIGKIPGSKFRKDVRRRCMELAEIYTSTLGNGIKSGSLPKLSDHDPVIVQTGHQPNFYHPGIIVKYILIDNLVKRLGCVGINTIVDSDICEAFNLDLSSEQGDIKSTVSFRPLEKPVPYENISSPDNEELNAFFSSIENNLTSSTYQKIRENFKEWQTALKKYPLKKENKISSFFSTAKRSFLGDNNASFYEIPLSLLSESKEFLSFFLHLAKHRKRFAGIYNARLSEYRKAHKLRYNANPFPDLLITDDTVELPFWFLNGETRTDLKVKEVHGEEILISGETELIKLSSCDNEEWLLSIPILKNIRPKAIPQTLFYRMFLSDIFIHGIGGAKYDTITDNIILDFFNVSPPVYIVATMTKYPEIEVENHNDKISELENILRDIKYNPDRYTGEEGISYVCRKKELLDEIKKSGADKKKTGKEISDINIKLFDLLASYIKGVEDELKDVRQKQEFFQTVMRRDLPYFFFSQKELVELI